ncbi:hypothetical protein [Brevundimonas sp. AAP58]|uniref:hypothetical protein n=1 Tax=Brevundimonas sp. AAP58 TaxID=1523422 RepID=UPI0012E1C91A|nr:hypothetical protein [Brevundimonas sp. AAP58]
MTAALMSMPRDAASVARAIHLWDGDWITTGEERNQAILTNVREVVLEAVSEASPICRDAKIDGPRFVVVADQARSAIVLVLGSGSWRWAELADPTSGVPPMVFRAR